MKKEGQSWSLEVSLALVIFITVFIFFYASTMFPREPAMKDLSTQAETASREFVSPDSASGLGLIVGNELDDEKLKGIREGRYGSYEELKRKLNIKDDFCIYIRDENGELIPISSDAVGVGNSRLTLSGAEPCKPPYTPTPP